MYSYFSEKFGTIGRSLSSLSHLWRACEHRVSSCPAFHTNLYHGSHMGDAAPWCYIRLIWRQTRLKDEPGDTWWGRYCYFSYHKMYAVHCKKSHWYSRQSWVRDQMAMPLLHVSQAHEIYRLNCCHIVSNVCTTFMYLLVYFTYLSSLVPKGSDGYVCMWVCIGDDKDKE